jgi:hypothetical protein
VGRERRLDIVGEREERNICKYCMYRRDMSNYLDTIQHNFDTTHIGIT